MMAAMDPVATVAVLEEVRFEVERLYLSKVVSEEA